MKNPTFLKRYLSIVALYIIYSSSLAGQDILPPIRPWHGESEKLIVSNNHPWITPAETDNFKFTPDYEKTIQWLRNLEQSTDHLLLDTIGISAQNRPIMMVIASSQKLNQNKDPGFSINDTGKPKVLIQAGIHSGEIDGKDAGLMLLRDIIHGNKMYLLDELDLLFVPALSVDGHENASPFNRPNQRGPENMGWRTNARNLNLNRDYSKLETEGVRAIVDVMTSYYPIFYMDIHVTDGADYQHDITYGYRKKNGYSPILSKWMSERYQPAVDKALSAMGHIPGPLIFTYKTDDFENGIIDYALPLRFSDAYGDARHIPSVLVENHSLKPYKQRVLGTYVLLEESLKVLSTDVEQVQELILRQHKVLPDSLPLNYSFNDIQEDSTDLKLFKHIKIKSPFSGQDYTEWKDDTISKRVPIIKMDKGVDQVKVPKAYWIPAEWKEVIKKLDIHGINQIVLTESAEKELDQYYIEHYEINPVPSEGRFRFKDFDLSMEKRKMKFAPGSVIIHREFTNNFILAMLLLEPKAADSFFQWGYFNSILSRTEYIESYVMGPLIMDMARKDLEIINDFHKAKEQNPELENNPRAIFEWFYSRSPYFDKNWKYYPIGIEYN